MRHRMHGRRLNRNKGQRTALRKGMIADLLCHEQILTTEAKARMLGSATEKMITLAKRGLVFSESNPSRVVHARRLAAARLPQYRTIIDEDGQEEEVNVVRVLFNDIAPRYANRSGGYTRMIKVGKRPGDNADMAVLMLVEEE